MLAPTEVKSGRWLSHLKKQGATVGQDKILPTLFLTPLVPVNTLQPQVACLVHTLALQTTSLHQIAVPKLQCALQVIILSLKSILYQAEYTEFDNVKGKGLRK